MKDWLKHLTVISIKLVGSPDGCLECGISFYDYNVSHFQVLQTKAYIEKEAKFLFAENSVHLYLLAPGMITITCIQV